MKPLQTNEWLAQVSTDDLARELAFRAAKDGFDLDKLKKGMECFFCGKQMTAYPKDMDKRLTDYLPTVLDYLAKTGRSTFEPYDVFEGDHRKVSDFYKLNYWDMIEELDGGRWKLTEKCRQFIRCNIQVPKRLWVFNWKNKKRRMVVPDNEYVTIDKLDPRWQVTRADYVMEGERVSYAAIRNARLL
jgi:hypothetical protein